MKKQKPISKKKVKDWHDRIFNEFKTTCNYIHPVYPDTYKVLKEMEKAYAK